MYFNSGINLFNGQCYVSYPGYTNLYTVDHPDLAEEDLSEVSTHSCADADAEGTADNPEQMFNGNDMAASILANLYQSSITGMNTHRKIKFCCGVNVSVEKTLPTLSNLLLALKVHPTTEWPVSSIRRKRVADRTVEDNQILSLVKVHEVIYPMFKSLCTSDSI